MFHGNAVIADEAFMAILEQFMTIRCHAPIEKAILGLGPDWCLTSHSFLIHRRLSRVNGAEFARNFTFSVTVKDGKAIGQVDQYSAFEMKPNTEADLFVQPRESLEIVFRRAGDGRVTGVVLRRAGDIGSGFSRKEPSQPGATQ